MKSVATVSLSDGLSTALGLSRQVLVTPKLCAWVKCRKFSSAATSAFYTFKICTSAYPHFTPGPYNSHCNLPCVSSPVGNSPRVA